MRRQDIQMETKIREAKAALRKQVRGELKKMTPEEQSAASARGRTMLQEQSLWKESRSVLFFAPLQGELDILPLVTEALSAGKLVALPRFDAEANGYIACQIKDLMQDVRTGYLGIREPVERCNKATVDRLDLILVPGVAFDLHGHRLGRGKGCYDQLLTILRGVTCGVAFDRQIVDQIPVAPHDITLHYILTPSRWIQV